MRVVSGRARCAQVVGARSAVRRPGPGAAADQGPLPHVRGRAQAAAHLDHGHRRHRQVPAGVGVLQVLRRPPSDHVLAPGALSLVRRRRHVLGARGHGSDARAHHGGRGALERTPEARRYRRRAPARTRASAASSSHGFAISSGSRKAGSNARTSSPPGASSSSVSQTCTRRSWSSRTCSGPTLAARLHRVPARVVAVLPALRRHTRSPRAAGEARRLGLGDAQLHVDLPRAAVQVGHGRTPRRARAWASARADDADTRSRGGHPAVRGRDRPDAPRPRGARAGGRPSTGRPERSRRWRCRRRCTPSSRRASTD